jgi:hypothetical protein
MRKMKFGDLRSTVKQYEEYNLNLADFREIEKSINGKEPNNIDDKKTCENCKTMIYENNYHKGWKVRI